MNIFPHSHSPLRAEDSSFSFSQSYKKLKYEVSLAYTKSSAGESWWNKIEPHNLYLGALPLQNKGHLDSLKNLGVTRVLSMVEDFEIEDGWFNTPVKQQTWEENGIRVKHIQAADFLPLSHDHLGEGIEYLTKTLAEGHTVYVHCKAGRGRSASIVIGFLMKHHHLSFEDAFDEVKRQRPQINLNREQCKAILSFFNHDASTVDSIAKETTSGEIYNFLHNLNEFSEEGLSKLLDNLLYYVIDGGGFDSATKIPAVLSTWMPAIEIESTLARRDRYLREYQGDQERAAEAAITRNHSLSRPLKKWVAGSVPLIGTPTFYTMSLWHQLREIALIAAIHGHDVNDSEVRLKILSCLVGGDLFKIPALSVKYVAKAIAKEIVRDMPLYAGGVAVIPARFVFDYFSNHKAYVATHAKQMFAGEHSIPIHEDTYNPNTRILRNIQSRL